MNLFYVIGIIIIYLLTVFLARYFNKKTYEYNNFSPRWWLLWLIPFYNIVWFAIIYITQTNVFPQLKFNNRLWKQFTGKNW